MKELKFTEGDTLSQLKESPLMMHSEIKGCFWIIPNFVGICYDWNGSILKVCLRLVVKDIVCCELRDEGACCKLEASIRLAKASIEVCLESIDGHLCLTWKGEVCYRLLPWEKWKCASGGGKIICFT